ncbi:hypothetical protein DQ04_01311060 [Trypanosoma grayi]|uniref:hypothetical protein n=1 Tax=Trypanosoma grayi TaxID=71804 RepID=UPI0004F488AE|nr:hypothetical protein DQ04_01311060 [Trypanosoma grayi]KEG12947.1 hypothetical protein DQ04_01311060 [Trypanosoma grayi]
MRSKRHSPQQSNGATVLPPNKVAELVRQLAEAQYEAQQLRQRVELVQRENTSFQDAVSKRKIEEDLATVVQQQRCDDDKSLEAGRTGAYVNNSNNCIEKSSFIDRLLSPPKLTTRPMPPPDSNGALPSPLRPFTTKTDEPSAAPVGAADGHASSSSELYWKRKYAKLKRVHEKALRERDLQLAEVQQLVFQIHEEQDELQHRHERDRLQHKLDQEAKDRMQLEARTKTLEEEAAAWRQRYLRLVEEPAPLRCRTLAQDLPAAAGDAGDIGRAYLTEGLNHTDASFVLLDSAMTSMRETDAPAQRARVPLASHHNSVTSGKYSGVEQQLHHHHHHHQQQHQHQQRQRLQCGGGGTSLSPTESYTVPPHVHATVGNRSMAIQVGPSTATTASQTTTCFWKSVGTQTDTEWEGDDNNDGIQSTKNFEPTQRVRVGSAYTNSRATSMLPGYHLREAPWTPVASFVAPQPPQCGTSKGHFYYTEGETQANTNAYVTSPMPLFKQPFDREPAPNTPPTAVAGSADSFNSAGFGFALGAEQAKRDRLDEDIRKHDQLLEAVAKLQRQAQRAAKTPSF